MSEAPRFPSPARFFADRQTFNPDSPVPEILSKDAALARAVDHVGRIFENWEELFLLVQAYEEKLRKRWTKKTPAQRAAILKAACPGIPEQHRPDVCALIEETIEERRAGSRFRDVYLMPYINLEDLVKTKNLLLLFNSRGRHAPGAFVWADLLTQHVGRTSEGILPAHIPNCTMYLTSARTPSEFMRIMDWKEHRNAYQDLQMGIGLQPGTGLVVLEAQAKMLSFLLHCAKQLLFDLPQAKNDLGSLPEPPPLDDPATDPELSSLSTYSVEAAYRVPARFDVAHILRLSDAHVEDALDHFWALREDPAYFRDQAIEGSEHRQEQLLTKGEGRHPHLYRHAFWDAVIWTMAFRAYEAVVVWSAIRARLREIQSLQNKYGFALAPDRPLPSEYLDQLAYLRAIVKQALETTDEALQMGFVSSPPLRRFWYRRPFDPHVPHIHAESRPVDPKDPPPKVCAIHGRALLDERQRFLLGRHNILDEMDRLVQSDPKERASLSSWVFDTLSSMAAFSELDRQLVLHRPSAAYQVTVDDEAARQAFLRYAAPLAKLQVLAQSGALSLCDLGAPKDDRFVHPHEKKPTAAGTAQRRKAETELDMFWGQFDTFAHGRLGEPLADVFSGFIAPRPLERTPPWEHKPRSGRRESPEARPLSVISDLQARTKRALSRDPSESPKKKRTRMFDAPGPALNIAAFHTAPSAYVDVSKRSYKVFTRLLAVEREIGEVVWADFMQAMLAVGCGAKRHMGTTWLFTIPPALDVGDARVPILVREPHLVPNLSVSSVRRIGRRLAKKFGWSIKMFVSE
jgi:hypothetical protein